METTMYRELYRVPIAGMIGYMMSLVILGQDEHFA